MEILKLEVDTFWGLLRPIIVIIMLAGILGIITKSKIITFEKYLALFKVIFYAILATLTFILSAKVVGDDIQVAVGIPERLAIAQILVIVLSLLEVGSNLVTMFSQPKSEFHLVKRDQFNEFQNKQSEELLELKLRINELEKTEITHNR